MGVIVGGVGGSGEDGVEESLCVDLTEHGCEEHDGGDGQPDGGAHYGSGGGGCGWGVSDLVVKEEEIAELLGLLW
jgi:hypothetical protein